MKKLMKGNIFWPTLVMFLIALALFIIASIEGKGKEIEGLKSAWTMTWQILPLLLFAFIAAGMVEALIPREMVGRWVGNESGMRGIMIGTLAGALTPGGPYVSLPVAAGFLKAGAGMSTMVAFVAGWSLMSVARLPLEVGILGWRFTWIHMLSVLLLAPVAGLLAGLIVRWLE